MDLFIQVIVWGLVSTVFVVLNLKIYRDPEFVERGKGGFADRWSSRTREQRLQHYKRTARWMLFVSVLPVSMFLLGLVGLLIDLWLWFR